MLVHGLAIALVGVTRALLDHIPHLEHQYVRLVQLEHGLVLLRQAAIRVMLVHGLGQVQHRAPHALQERGQLQREHPALLLV